jgi:hypothetical protein
MSIDRVNIQTTSFRLQASNIRGPQLRTLVDRLSRAAGAQSTASSARLSGSLAMQSPAARFNDLSPALSGAGASGFAPGGAESLSSLDARGLLSLVMTVMQRLVDAIVQMLSSVAAGAGDGSSGAGDSRGAGGSSTSCGASAATPTKPGDLATRFASRDTGSSSGGSPGSSSAGSTPANSRERPGGVGRLLARIGKGALAIGANAVPGGGLATAALSSCGAGGSSGSSSGGSGCEPAGGASGGSGGCGTAGGGIAPSSGGGSLEDRIFAFLTEKLREIEQELDGAMKQADASGASGDSRSAATQKVPQLVQKRSEMVELLSNTLKTMHDSTQAVNRNIRT